MNKYAYLEELEKRIGRLSQYQVDNIVNDYSQAISRMLDDYMDWDRIQNEIGTPKEAARRILDGRPMYIASDRSQRNGQGYGQRDGQDYRQRDDQDYRQRNGRDYGQTDNGNGYYGAPPKAGKRGMSGFWKAYLIMGIVTIPLTIALAAVVLAFMISAIAFIIGGPAAFIYSIVLAIMSASPLLFFTFGGASLLLLGAGLLMLWGAKRLFWPIKAMFKAGR